jgi:hypothetical protein
MSLKLIIKTKMLEIYRGINDFKKGYQPRINIIKHENGNVLTDPRVFSIGAKISLTRC